MHSAKTSIFNEVYHRYKHALYNYSIKITRSTMQAEDIVHNTFLRYYNNMEQIKDNAKTEQWLFTVARNEAMQYFRKNQLRGEDSIERAQTIVSGSSPQTEAEISEVATAIAEELQIMPEALSSVFQLKEYGGLGYDEIAEVLLISRDLVKSRLFSARKRLKTVLKPFKK